MQLSVSFQYYVRISFRRNRRGETCDETVQRSSSGTSRNMQFLLADESKKFHKKKESFNRVKPEKTAWVGGNEISEFTAIIESVSYE